MSDRMVLASPTFLSDVSTIVWKETKEMWQSQPGRFGRGWLSVLLLMVVFGVFMPYQFGAEWVTSPMALIYWAWVPVLLVSGVVAQSFAGERERHTLESLLATRLSDLAILVGKIVAVVTYAWGVTLAALIVGVITVNLFYPADVAISIVAISLLISVLGAAAGVLVSLRAGTVRQAQQVLSMFTLVLVFGSVYGLQALPVDWASILGQAAEGSALPPSGVLVVCGVLLVADVVLLGAARVRFRRTRLILD